MCDREDCKEYPIYGVQPHKCGYRHGKGFIGGSESLPQSDWPENFIPVEEYLKLQRRFRHLFEPKRQVSILEELQAEVDAYWHGVGEQDALTVVQEVRR